MTSLIKLLYLSFLFLVISSSSLYGQEVVSGLFYNPALESGKNQRDELKSASSAVILPFYDDFRYPQVFPDQTLWSDYNVFINDAFSKNGLNHGVATFDAIDSAGYIYEDASIAPFAADYLTSRSIRLDSLFSPLKRAINKSDSLYLSFWYQPQGLGNDPQSGDSLMLQFEASSDGNKFWNTVWSTEGMKLDTFYLHNGTWWKQVLIPITDSALYFHNDFRFRFIGHASLAGDMLQSWQSNMDQWNVDVVYLNVGRNMDDTTTNWMGFASAAPKMLKSYSAMPYWQYGDNPGLVLRDTLTNYVANLSGQLKNGRYEYIVRDEAGNDVDSYLGGLFLLDPFPIEGYLAEQKVAKPAVSRILPIDPIGGVSTTYFDIVHKITTFESGSDTRLDSVVYRQSFEDYFSYDDGTPEAGYGVTPSGAQFAIRFKLSKPDMIKGVDIFFNRTQNSANQQYFNLRFWDDNNGLPGKLLRSDTIVRVDFGDNLNQFVRYSLPQPVLALNAFHIGLQQRTNDNLNVGFDLSMDNSANQSYNVDGTWIRSQYAGALMIRPLMTGTTSKSDVSNGSKGVLFYPNPILNSTVEVEFDGSVGQRLKLDFFSISGQYITSAEIQGVSSLPSLANGLYLVKVTNLSNNKVYFDKISIAN